MAARVQRSAQVSWLRLAQASSMPHNPLLPPPPTPCPATFINAKITSTAHLKSILYHTKPQLKLQQHQPKPKHCATISTHSKSSSTTKLTSKSSSHYNTKISYYSTTTSSSSSSSSSSSGSGNGQSPFTSTFLGLGIGLGVLAVGFSIQRRQVHSESAALIPHTGGSQRGRGLHNDLDELSLVRIGEQGSTKSAELKNGGKDGVRPVNPKTGLPFYTRAEVSSHTSLQSGGVWITHQDGVYDISEFIPIHPGGEKILLAAGQSIDPFWAIFSVHNTKETRALLETYRIGDLVPLDQDPSASSSTTSPELEALSKLFENDPPRDPRLIVRSARPCNAECPPDALSENFVTPNHLFFVRNHLPVPKIDPDTFHLSIDPGPNLPELSISLEDLKTKYPKTQVMATFQCAGNRRKEMHDVKGVKGLQWTQGALGNAVWGGVRLRDVLKGAGVDVDSVDPNGVEHVVFDGADGYGASIPLHKALDSRGDVLLAYEMNGEPIPPDHGYPLRAVVPGHVAARSVKWVSSIRLSEDESESHWQRRDYKGFGPSKSLEESKYDESVSIQEMPVQSAILSPSPSSTVAMDPESKTIKVEGYAWSGGGRGIVRVDVSADGGKTWIDAQRLQRANQPRGREWAWTRWEAQVPLSKAEDGEGGEVEIVCKAVDTSYNEQPERFESTYNVRGVLVSAWHRVKAKVVKEREEKKIRE
ncbi:hypothetical protein HDV05_000935 [Chytridiales sp. JEL 0842]|nr:hypothetical protein HDV05_000935 [Chytridiales sp. JEL 0842]